MGGALPHTYTHTHIHKKTPTTPTHTFSLTHTHTHTLLDLRVRKVPGQPDAANKLACLPPVKDWQQLGRRSDENGNLWISKSQVAASQCFASDCSAASQQSCTHTHTHTLTHTHSLTHTHTLTHTLTHINKQTHSIPARTSPSSVTHVLAIDDMVVLRTASTSVASSCCSAPARCPRRRLWRYCRSPAGRRLCRRLWLW